VLATIWQHLPGDIGLALDIRKGQLVVSPQEPNGSTILTDLLDPNRLLLFGESRADEVFLQRVSEFRSIR
jgi:hypothetical protein